MKLFEKKRECGKKFTLFNREKFLMNIEFLFLIAKKKEDKENFPL